MGDQAGLAMLADGLPAQSVPQKRPADAPAQGERRTKLRHYDLLPAQTLNPMGSSGLEVVNDRDLWRMLCQGNKQAAVFSEICLKEPERRAVALSRFAQVYCEAIQRFKSNQYSQALLKETVYEKIIKEADMLLELLTKFNLQEFAQRQVSGMRSVAYAKAAVGTRLDRGTIDQACTALHEWLSRESPLRSFLAYLAGGGCYWSAYAHERAIRCFITAGQGSKEDLLEAVTSRTAGSDGAGASSGTASMSALDRIR